MSNIKFWFFSNYWWIILLVMAVATCIMWVAENSIASIVSVVGLALPMLYFLQKQKLEEMRLFRDLFKEFNERYDAMNERLAEIRGITEGELNDSEKKLLIDYFNLCGEEYLYYRQGYIPPEVWDAWALGMKEIIDCPRVSDLWFVESASGSYYQLPLKPSKLRT